MTPSCVELPPSVMTFSYRGTSLTRKRTPLGLYRRPMPRVLGGSEGGGRILMGAVPLPPTSSSTEFGDFTKKSFYKKRASFREESISTLIFVGYFFHNISGIG